MRGNQHNTLTFNHISSDTATLTDARVRPQIHQHLNNKNSNHLCLTARGSRGPHKVLLRSSNEPPLYLWCGRDGGFPPPPRLPPALPVLPLGGPPHPPPPNPPSLPPPPSTHQG